MKCWPREYPSSPGIDCSPLESSVVLLPREPVTRVIMDHLVKRKADCGGQSGCGQVRLTSDSPLSSVLGNKTVPWRLMAKD